MAIDIRPASTVEDYQLEEWMRCPYKYYHKNILGIAPDYLNWRQMAQYGVNHVINDYYLLPNSERTDAKILELVQRRWTNKISRFYSYSHFHEVRSEIAGNLMYFLLEDQQSTPPLILFERFKVWVDELHVHLSMIFQLVQGTEKSYVIKKYLVDEDPDVISMFKHMAIIFSCKAFLALPEKIEVYLLLSGNKLVFEPSQNDIKESIDFLNLTKKLMDDASYYTKSDSVTECKTCPFRNKCHQEANQKTKIYH
jgi:hypothetical protein